MNHRATLTQQAIQAAKKQDWASALTLNQELLNSDSKDLAAYNRLGVAYLQLNEKKCFKSF